MCGPLDVGCHTEEALGSAAGKFYDVVADGLRSGLEYVSTFWMEVPSPTLAEGSGQNWVGSPVVTEMQGYLMPLTAAFAVISFSIALLQIGLSPERASEGMKGILRQMAAVVLGTVPALAVTQLMMEAGDEFSPWLIEQAAGGEASEVLAAGMIPSSTPGAELGLLLFVFLFALLGSIMQCVFMVVRAAAILVLFVMLPLMAAGAATEEGWLRLKRLWMLIIGFVLYKPVAAIIFAVGLRLMSEGDSGLDDVQNAFYGLTVIVMAALALPAFIKFVMPIAAAGSSSAFSGAAGAGVIAGGAAVVGLAGTGGAGAAAGAGRASGRGAGSAGTTAQGAGHGDLTSGGAGGGATALSGAVDGGSNGAGGGVGASNDGSTGKHKASGTTADQAGSSANGSSPSGSTPSGSSANGSRAKGSANGGRGTGGSVAAAAGAGPNASTGGTTGGTSGERQAGDGEAGGASGAEPSTPMTAPAAEAASSGAPSAAPGGATVSEVPSRPGRGDGAARAVGDVAQRVTRAGDEAAEGAES